MERCFTKVLKHTSKPCSKHTLIHTFKLMTLKLWENANEVLWFCVHLHLCEGLEAEIKLQTDSNLLTFSNYGCRMLKWRLEVEVKTITSSLWCRIIISESNDWKLT